MNQKFNAIAGLVLAAVIGSGCMAWEKVGGAYEAREDSFQVDLPANWYKSVRTKDALLITRDGTMLQAIEIFRMPIDKNLSHTKRKLDKDLLPLELADVISDDIRSNSTIVSPEIVENAPTNVSGYPGFRLVYSFRTKDGLKRKGVQYGILRGSWYYGLRYSAAVRHYFDRDIATFEKVKESFKIKL